MCGFVGFRITQDFHHFAASLKAATDSLRHRGPDDAGIFFDDLHGVGLGHRRLSIIDLSPTGSQPMESNDGNLVIVFNGEVYNFLDIRRDLVRLGHAFMGTSDTEVVLAAYAQWGEDCLERFNGMFSLAIWDRRKGHLFLARDRLGIKPLYYSFTEKGLLFGSELKALMAMNGFARRIDPDAFSLYLHYQYIPAPRTIFFDTFKLEPGHFLLYDGNQVSKKRWWTPTENRPANDPVETIDKEDALRRLDSLLTRVVSDHLISDVPLGALLSGGVDSSIVVAMMQKVSDSPVRTFSIGFTEQGFNEAPWARKVADHLGTAHTELYVSPQDALHTIDRLAEIYDEPFADSSAVPTFLVSKLTRDQVTVALSGDGGDEQFAGYVRYWMTDTMTRTMNWIPTGTRKFVKQVLGMIPASKTARYYDRIRHLLPRRFQVANFPDKWEKLINQLGYADLSDLYRMTVSIWSKEAVLQLTGRPVPSGTFENAFMAPSHRCVMDRLMMVDRQTYLPDAMLTKVDRASMAASLEVRVPLLDHRVVEFTSRLPVSLKYRSGKGKYLLMELLTRYVPRHLVERPKMGFGVPIAQWFRNELQELLHDYLSTDRLKAEGRLDADVVRQILKEHQQGTKDHHHRLWSLLMWEMWRDRWQMG